MQGNPIFMHEAIRLATKNIAAGLGGPFGAVIVQNGKIIATGTNLVTSTNDPTAHAEVVAIRRAAAALKRFNLAGCEIYTSCEPCPMCLAAAYWASCDAIFYGNTAADAADIGFSDAFLYDEIRRLPEQRRIPSMNFMREHALSSFEAWRRYPGRVEY